MGEGRSPTEFLRALIAAEGGAISVARFMAEALYHPTFGYYTRRIGTVGRTGDFSTSATLNPALGGALAAWALARRRETTWTGSRWHLIELGGGTGELAAAILDALGWRARWTLRYHLVEVSESLRAQQQRRLATFRRVEWHKNIRQALTASAGQALVFSNEFVDAFPCRQLRWDRSTTAWQEVQVSWPPDAASPQETFVLWRGEPPPAEHLSETPGQRIEVHQAYRDWLEGCLPLWRAGRWLTIDYGDLLPALYHRRPRGTLRAYCRHERYVGTEVYQRFGQQDITADVNFTDLQAWGTAAGLTTIRFEDQASFLESWLPKNPRRQGDARLDFLCDPVGAGGAFKVLEQARSPAPTQNAA